MTRLVDQITIPLKCPKCSHETEQTLARLKDDPILVCPSCGANFRVESDGTAQDTADKLDELDRALDKFKG